MKLPKIFQSKLFLIAALVVLLGVFALELQQWQQRHKIDLEIQKLKHDQADLQARNNALQQSLQYFSSDNYKEKLAREQLGLKKDGEIVVDFPSNGVPSNQPQAQAPASNNFQKWWQYIFNNHKT